MSRLALTTGCLLAALITLVHFGSAAQKEAGAKLDRAKSLQTMVDAARDTYDATSSSYEAGKASSDAVYTWSRHWLVAETKSAKDKKGAMQASVDHLERMRKLHAKVKALRDNGSKGGEQERYEATRFYVAEAELTLLDAGEDKAATR